MSNCSCLCVYSVADQNINVRATQANKAEINGIFLIESSFIETSKSPVVYFGNYRISYRVWKIAFENFVIICYRVKHEKWKQKALRVLTAHDAQQRSKHSILEKIVHVDRWK